MEKHDSWLRRAGALAAAFAASPVFAASWSMPHFSPSDWPNYLLVGSFELLVVALLLKLFPPSERMREPERQYPPAATESESGYSIGAHRNSHLNPF
jgi:hypothetical protein